MTDAVADERKQDLDRLLQALEGLVRRIEGDLGNSVRCTLPYIKAHKALREVKARESARRDN